MLTNKDLNQIDNAIKRRLETDVREIIHGAFQDFYENIFEPYVNKNESEHTEMIREMKSMKKEINGLKDEQ